MGQRELAIYYSERSTIIRHDAACDNHTILDDITRRDWPRAVTSTQETLLFLRDRNRALGRQIVEPVADSLVIAEELECLAVEVRPIAPQLVAELEFEPLPRPLPLAVMFDEPDLPVLRIKPVVIEETRVIFKKLDF